MNETGANSRTVWLSEGDWHGRKVWVESSIGECLIPGHDLEEMHHLGPDGKDYGVTGFLWCDECAGVADAPLFLSARGSEL